MKIETLINPIKKFSQKFILIVSCLLAFILGWTGNGINAVSAATLGNPNPLIAAVERSARENQVEDRFQSDSGKVQSKFESAAQKANENDAAATQELKGSTEDYLNNTKNPLESAADQAQDTGEGVIDTIKDFFNK